MIEDLKVCEPYLESACKIAGEILGKPSESGNWNIKGCYQYETGEYSDKLWFGTGGTYGSKIEDTQKSGTSRPEGIDCKTSIW